MDRLKLCFFILLFVTSSLGTIWEFGQDNRRSTVVSSSDGEISLDQKSKRVALTVPACYEIVYVRVEVKNELATPSVSYTKDTNTVAISYRAKQSSLSEYKVTTKAIQQKHCGQNKRGKKTTKRSRSSEESEEYTETKKRHRRQKNIQGKLTAKWLPVWPGDSLYYY